MYIYEPKTLFSTWSNKKIGNILGISSILSIFWTKILNFLQFAKKFELFFMPIFETLISIAHNLNEKNLSWKMP